ncbi:hypothetical protein A2715_02020 [Candidatus Woesebacteria bacterium RIFCSPHIGHO2_01_FULL_39_32]|uniref:rRNA (Adenine-N(6)-)-methyltransferase n=2 Tax=Candidatus Woeseibacteriota TaxID=1752722 RepID=A0A0G0Q069_9BACT|nr:MAG: rRNA (Adenine-N(6)-)-methyltransferase [Candidatus Woesebacteria bacterium GW2011_GWA1_39_8]OGM03439.1 MAG: hypothetical protein A2124_02255 [Candidatus Woesebacteria bacterium GWB1_37_5]OGM23934.1 MAG: hypothetical protein A2715_02020 [Candidatus Woesebacteria bacterium RIFCSPHIGHO2_01_FULL_39_32]OGM37440.1 MAG: hypothetical protein A3F01_03255 [Candidatus Woesebacteria bacterium RIFCSPHIGHO2_12_FULL_38_11]OGM64123.1 MAG: hypothetical protein A2893_03260 [Candidatus Woesebacteria bacte
MRYKQRQRLYSQNFLFNRKLITKLVSRSSIGKKDTVLEIGPGRGIITQELLKVAAKVIAVELDSKLYLQLKEKFKNVKNLELVHDKFSNFKLPLYPYKVFANMPFVITADVIRKLTSDNNFQEGYLVVQKEAAKKFIGLPYDSKNQMLATLLKPWFEINVCWEFNRYDFVPLPSVDTTMIRIIRVKKPVIDQNRARLYKDFVLYSYNRSKVAKLIFTQLIKQFNNFVRKANPEQISTVTQTARRISRQQELIQKIHRTRADKNWRKF